MPDQFSELKPGDRLPGIPSQPWNKFLGLTKLGAHPPGVEALGTSGVEVIVSNQTGAGLGVYSVVGLDALDDYQADPDSWLAEDRFAGVAPAAGSVIAVVQEGLDVGQAGRARLLGRTACQVNLTDVSHLYAVPTVGNTTYLTSAAAGPVCIVQLENDWSATGLQWAVVVLLGVAAGGGSAFARFGLAAALATTDASQAACPVLEAWGGPNPGATITVYNLPASSGYIFFGPMGHKGLATFDADAGKWWIVQLECGTGPSGGGGGGFTGTIGN